MEIPHNVTEQVIEQERTEILQQLEDWFETPMIVLGFVWLALLIIELIWGLSPILEVSSTVIWISFIVDFSIRLILAPRKLAYLKNNWLTVLALLLPALRIFRAVRVIRLLRLARTARSLTLVRIITSLNRGMRALSATMRRRGFGYVLIFTTIVVIAGAAGMFAFENKVPGGLESYGAALWWTAMLLTSIGSEYWPQTAEGRILSLILAIYGFAVFGYVTATLATFFIERDAEDDAAELAGARSVEDLRTEIAALRVELRRLQHPSSSTNFE